MQQQRHSSRQPSGLATASAAAAESASATAAESASAAAADSRHPPPWREAEHNYQGRDVRQKRGDCFDEPRNLDPDKFVDYCEQCGDYNSAKIRWIRNYEDGANASFYAAGKECLNVYRCGTTDVADYLHIGVCFRCESVLCERCAFERFNAVQRDGQPSDRVDMGRDYLHHGPKGGRGHYSRTPCVYFHDIGRYHNGCYRGRFCGYSHDEQASR